MLLMSKDKLPQAFRNTRSENPPKQTNKHYKDPGLVQDFCTVLYPNFDI